ncbi:bacterial regulatory, luxR family protein (plasmid) [Burkholderia cepacia]|nr:bacterial regulatory, luxR family protein [Burkholderia cepacia]
MSRLHFAGRRRPRPARRGDESREHVRANAHNRRRAFSRCRLGAPHDEAAAGDGPARHTLPQPRIVTPAPHVAASQRAVQSVVLTPKEHAIFQLLTRNLSNEEIAVALDVGEETGNWHLKS